MERTDGDGHPLFVAILHFTVDQMERIDECRKL